MKIILTEEQFKNLVTLMEASLGLDVDLGDRKETFDWLESAEGVLYDYPEYYATYSNDFKWPIPAINLKYLDKLKETFAKSRKGICYNGHNKCYDKVLVYGLDPKTKKVDFKEYKFVWDKTNKNGTFRDTGVNLLPEIVVTGYKDGGTNVSNATKTIIRLLKSRGVTDPKVIAAILGICSKESGFMLQTEQTHTGTIDQLREWFPPLRNFTNEEIERLRLNQRRFYNKVYGATTPTGKNLGNINPNDGYNYRGRGWNGITGRLIYKTVGYENNPEKLETPEHATNALINFYDNASGILKKEYSDDAPMSLIVRDYINATGGFSPNNNSPFVLSNYNRAYDYVLKTFIKNGNLVVPGFDPITVTP
jgi:predicted chitinase